MSDRTINITVVRPGQTGPAGEPGATTWDGLTGTANHIPFDTAPTGVPTTEGTASWNDTDGTLDLVMKGGNVTQQVGQEILIRVVNKSGSTIANGKAVYISGAQGNRIAVGLADNTDADTDHSIGIATEDIANNQEGFVTAFGLVRDLDTSAWSEGDEMWLSTSGNLVNTPPASPAKNVRMGYVVNDHAVNGSIFVTTHPGRTLGEVDGVSITSPATNDLLRYDSVSGLWGNYPAAELPGVLGFVNVKGAPYNAVGDGVADDTAAIQAAIDTGENVYFPKGRYKLTAKLDLDHVNSAPTSGVPIIRGQKFFGDGPAKSVLYQSTSSAHIFDISQTSSFYGHIFGIAFEGTGGNSSTGYGLASTGGGPHNSWRIENCYFYWLYAGIRAALEDTQIVNCTVDSCVEGINLELAVNGAAINQNKVIGSIIVYQAQPTNKRPTVPGKGVIINGGQGHEITGMDAGNEGMVTVIELNGTSSGTISGISTEMFPYTGQLVSCINGANAGESRWDVKNCNFVGFGAMASGDYPIVQGRYVSMPTKNVFKSGNWQQGLMKRVQSNELYTMAFQDNHGKPFATDLYIGATKQQSCLNSTFSEVGTQSPPTVTTNNVGQYFQKTNVTGQADSLYRFSKDASNTYFVADLLSYTMLTRGASGVPVYTTGTGTMTATTGTGNVLLGDQAVSTTSNPTFPSVNGATTLELRTGTTPRITIASNGNVTVNGTASFTTGGNISTTSGNMIVPNLFYFLVSGRGGFTMAADGVMTVINNAGSSFSRLQLGGTTSSFPAIKRNGTAINFRLADDSADAGITAGTASFSGRIAAGAQVQLKGYTVATLPGSPLEGDTAYVTDALTPTFLGALVGGGAVKTPVFYNGTAWVAY